MTKMRSALAVLFLALAGLCNGATGAQAQMFNFQVCNQTNYSASVAVSNLTAAGSSQFVVAGWWTVAPNSCSTIGTFPQGWVYYYAEVTGNSSLTWGGTAASLCVDYPGPFNRINLPGYSCPGDDLKGFNSVQIDSTTSEYSWTLN
jgi:uncharacterized membrane protein